MRRTHAAPSRTTASATSLTAIALAITGVLAKLIPLTRAGDGRTLNGFVGLNTPRLTPALDHVAHSPTPALRACRPRPRRVALARRRARVAVAIALLFVSTGATTEFLKHLLAAPRFDEWLGHAQIAAASWPSGHSTAAMTMALCAVLAAPPRLRPTVAAVGSAFAVAVAYAILTLGWHFPSDVFGGYLVAAAYVLVASRRSRSASCAGRAGAGWRRAAVPQTSSRRSCRAGGRGRGRRRRARTPTGAVRTTRAPHDLRGRRAGDRGLAAVIAGVIGSRVPGAASPAFGSARLPQRLVAAVGRAAEDEEQVREAVEVADELGVAVVAAAIARRSARRQTVRQTCRWAAAGVPPGSTKDFSGWSVALTSSQAPSSQLV